MPPEARLRVGVAGSSRAASLAATLAASSKPILDVRCHDDAGEGPSAFAASCDVLITIFDEEGAAEAALLGRDGLLRGAHAGLCLLELTPASPDFMAQVADRFSAAGARAFGGSLDGACAYVDSDLAADAQALDIVRAVAPVVRVTGARGSSKALAIVERLLACVTAMVAEEALALGESAGIPSATLIPLLLKGSGGNEALRDGAVRAEQTSPQRCERDLALAERLGNRVGHSLVFAAQLRAARRDFAGRKAVQP